MNAKRRKRLRDVADVLSGASGELENIIDEEQDCLDNTPESLQDTDSYCEREDFLDGMRDALDDLNSVINAVSDLL